MTEYECRVTLGGFREHAIADNRREAERAIKRSVERMPSQDLSREITVDVDCQYTARDRTEYEFSEDIDGVQIQR